MVSLIRRGVLDMIGGARPSIADPFLPKKIEEGRLDEIRECIGCNICVSGDWTMAPIRCTQNPTMGEEWRKGWHPETIAPKVSEDAVLVVGAGPAGLECTHALGKRGYTVHLAEATQELGGRVVREALLPGLAEWIRVRDHRQQQIARMANVEVYRASALSVDDILDFGFPHVVLATGARWRRDGVGRAHADPVPGFDGARVLTPDDIMGGAMPAGPVVLFDDDHFYMGGVLAELLRERGLDVTLVTPADTASAWTINTLEQPRIQRRLLELGVTLRLAQTVTAFRGDRADLACIYTGRTSEVACASLVTVTARLPETALYDALAAGEARLMKAGLRTVRAIGDAWCPSTIAAAVYAGHRFAREFEGPALSDVPFRRELPERVA